MCIFSLSALAAPFYFTTAYRKSQYEKFLLVLLNTLDFLAEQLLTIQKDEMRGEDIE